MAQRLPFHSVRPGAPMVFHNNDACEAGVLIQGAHWRAGDGGLSLCEECARLSAGVGQSRPTPLGSRSASRRMARAHRRAPAPHPRRVMSRCPTTDEVVWTGLMMTEELLGRLAGSHFSIWCPSCREHHPWPSIASWVDRGDGGAGSGVAVR